MLTRLEMNCSHWEMMRAHVESCAPMEGCGLLAGNGEKVSEVLLVANSEQSPKRFRMDASEQLRAFTEIDDRGLELLGIFHSHPADARPGATPAHRPSHSDIREAAYPVVHVIWSRQEGQWHAHGYWMEEGRISEVPLQLSTG